MIENSYFVELYITVLLTCRLKNNVVIFLLQVAEVGASRLDFEVLKLEKCIRLNQRST